MAKLVDLGFFRGVIAETVISTYNKYGEPNAAPMGVILEDEQHLIINLFSSSKTYGNIELNRCAVVNLTNDIMIFYRTAFKEVNTDGKLPSDWFEKSGSVNAPRLRFADASIDVSVTNLKPLDSRKIHAVFSVGQILTKPKYPQVYSRAFSLTLEAIIHATRVKAMINSKKESNQVGKLLEMIGNCNFVVNKVAPNSSYSFVMADLTKRIESWQGEK